MCTFHPLFWQERTCDCVMRSLELRQGSHATASVSKTNTLRSETTSIPTNPRTTRPVGYAFVDVSTPSEAERAIAELNGKTILDRKVSVQLARKPEPAGEQAETGGEGTRRRSSTRGRGRSNRVRGGRGGRAPRGVSGTSTSEMPPNTDKHRPATLLTRPPRLHPPTALLPTFLVKLLV